MKPEIPDTLVLDKAFLFKGVPVYFTEQGKGPVIVMLHGFLENKHCWHTIAKKLAETHRIICIDLPGHGKTNCLGYIHSMELMAEAVHHILKKLRIRKCAMVGHSMGGYVALAFAEANPEMMTGICLVHSTARADTEPKKRDRDRAIEIVKKNSALFIREVIPGLFYTTRQKPLKRLINQTIKMAKETPAQGIIAALEGMKIRLERELIIRFAPYPVWFIIGKYDRIIPYDGLFEQAALPEISQTIMLNCGHMGFLERPKETLQALQKFAEQV